MIDFNHVSIRRMELLRHHTSWSKDRGSLIGLKIQTRMQCRLTCKGGNSPTKQGSQITCPDRLTRRNHHGVNFLIKQRDSTTVIQSVR